MKRPFLSLVIPAYNEDKKIEKDIRKAFDYFQKKKISGEVIVSTDGVTDNTNKIVSSLMREFPNLTLISKKEKIGKGSAIKRGVEKAKGKYIMFADAGYCIPFKYIDAGLAKLDKDCDIALGNRADRSSVIKKRQPFYRNVGSNIFGFLVKYLGVPHYIEDTQCGFKIYKKHIAKSLFSQLKSKGMMFDLEHILRAKKNKYRIGTFPVEWSNDSDTKFNPVTGSFTNFLEIYRIKFKYKL